MPGISSVTPGWGSTTAISASPNSSSGMPNTAQSCTPGTAYSAASISAGEVLTPPHIPLLQQFSVIADKAKLGAGGDLADSAGLFQRVLGIGEGDGARFGRPVE